ncbi:MAG: pyridoxal 5'-phosphate synthase glutaminase subunit PdxT [Candidatus Neomarinimicrobiota bacterium]|jgi:5'-phosphate synthase pdxT subunit|nr:pyridoxal 5'-phosphate synthase glutaminase subunit PdxT [Candidatus Neomarinimicrobiota bacterium]
MTKKTIKVGVLGLQGAFQRHIEIINSLGAEAIDIRYKDQIEGCHGLIIPGGESTTMSKLIDEMNLRESLEKFPGMIFGTCAGAILLSEDGADPRVTPLRRTPVKVMRNAYGRQIESFVENISLSFNDKPFKAVFIRAPKFNNIDSSAEILGHLNGTNVLIRSGNNLLATFHPELTDDPRIHQYFLNCLQ